MHKSPASYPLPETCETKVGVVVAVVVAQDEVVLLLPIQPKASSKTPCSPSKNPP